MHVFIVGGSNSRRKDVYIADLIDKLKDHMVVNLSVGAAPSAMGFFSILREERIAEGSIVIWEYSLNDINFINSRNFSVMEILRYIEQSIILVRDKGAYFLPIIFTPQREENISGYSEFRARLHFLFSHYGIRFLDVSHAARTRFKVARLDSSFFDDGSHYAANSKIGVMISNWLKNTIIRGLPPIADADLLFLNDKLMIELFADFQGGAKQLFTNNVVSLSVYDPQLEKLFFVAERDNLILSAIFVVAYKQGGVLSFRKGSEVFLLSLSHAEPDFPKPLLKVVGVPGVLGKEITLMRGDVLEIGWSDTCKGAVAASGFRSTGLDLNARNGKVAAIALEKNCKDI